MSPERRMSIAKEECKVERRATDRRRKDGWGGGAVRGWRE